MKKYIPTIIGSFIWGLMIFRWLPFSVFTISYVQLLFLAAPLFLVPLCWQLSGIASNVQYIGLGASILLLVSFFVEQGLYAALFALPWLIVTSIIALRELSNWPKNKTIDLSSFSYIAAYLFLPIGAAWALSDRLGFQPMDFSYTIVLLTAVHFHYAGFIVPLLGSWLGHYFPNYLTKPMILSIISGVPLVAIGITTSQFGFSGWIEMLAVVVMAGGGMLLALSHIIIGWKNRHQMYGLFWGLGGLALLSGMTLAFLYGIRYILPISFLSIPWMYAVHGTLNAIGFALPSLFGWYLFFNKNKVA